MSAPTSRAAWSTAYPIWLPVQIRYRDLDPLAHVNNAVYLSYLELARVTYVEQRIGPVSPQDYTFVIARLEIDFLAPLHLGDEPAVGIKPLRVGRSSFTFGYCLVDTRSARAVARAQSVQVFFDPATGRARPLPAAWRAPLEADLRRFGAENPCAPLADERASEADAADRGSGATME